MSEPEAQPGVDVAVGDIEALLMRPLSTVEASYVPMLLERAMRVITRAASTYQVGVEELNTDAVRDVQTMLVARLLRNPSGYRSESDGQYTYSIDTTAANARMELTPDDLADLGLGGDGIMVWTPHYGAPRVRDGGGVIV
ncbi:MAG: Gp19/Gp15/Gp42 family protein [Arcanobacterium sp.]|nr:Gp19/Gp15/Gp42 family protein [Arcanobacterium sp.]